MMTSRCTDPKTKDTRLKGKISAEERARIKDQIRRDIQKELIDWLTCQPENHDSQTRSGMSDLCLHQTRSDVFLESDCHNFRPGDHYNILLEMKGILLTTFI